MHAILFGPKRTSVRMEQMIIVARDVQSQTPALTCAPSSFHEAIDSVGYFTGSELTLFNLCVSTGRALTDLPRNRRIVEEAQRCVDAVRGGP